jgi:hypothetical protein
LVDIQNETDLFDLQDSSLYVDSVFDITGVIRHDTRNPGFGEFYLQPNGSEDFALTQTTGLAESEELSFGLYPNPATDRLTLELPGPVAEVSLRDALGRRLKHRREVGRGRMQWSVGDLAPGVYFVTVRSEAGTATRRLLKR